MYIGILFYLDPLNHVVSSLIIHVPIKFWRQMEPGGKVSKIGYGMLRLKI